MAENEINENEESETTESGDETEEILRIARERFDLCVEAENSFRTKALDDMQFRVGEQWPAELRNDRESQGKPCLTINRIPTFLKQITNDQRQNRPSIKVHPIDNNADVETAKILQGIIKHIEVNSNADVALDTAFDGAASAGRGFFRLITDYSDPLSFDQEIKFKRIRNHLSVYMDPNSQEPDGSDMEWCFIIEDISPDEFKTQYPNSTLTGATSWDALGNTQKDWVTKENIRIAEYFYKVYEDTEIVLLSINGQKKVLKKSELPQLLPVGVQFLGERKTKITKVKWCKHNGVEILEETEFPSQWVPVIPVYGDEIDVNGELILEGIIRNAKDPQRMYNYWASAETETIALAPRAPFIGVEGQFEGHEDRWETANRVNHAYLEYKPIDINGQPAPAPQRNVFEPPVQAITQARSLASEDLKHTTGIYDASLGNKSNENSGIAIQRRNQQAQTGNFHFIDNLTRSIKHAGRILVDIIPKIYDTARAVRIVGEEDQEEIVMINQIFNHNGKDVSYNLGIGKYDVAVETGPSFATKRQEAAMSMLEMSKANPQLVAVAGDLMVKNMDWPGAHEVAERIKKTLPPGLAEDDKDKNKPIPPQIKAQMDQMGQVIDSLTQKLNESQDAIEKKTIELESRERIEFAKIQANIEIEMAKLGSQEATTLLAHQVAQIQRRLDMVNMNQPIESESENQNLNNGGADFEGGFGVPNEQPQPLTGGLSPGLPME